jgi:spore maturation protein B
VFPSFVIGPVLVLVFSLWLHLLPAGGWDDYAVRYMVLPMALLRSLSGSGAYAFSTELMKTHGPDSLVGTIAGTMQGSSETTFYVLSVYFGAVGVSKARHAVVVGVLSDVIAMLGAVWFVRWVVFS